MNNRKIGKLILALAGIILVGTGVSFNAAASLGNDLVGIVYDGIRNAAHLSAQQLGMASNLVNVALVCVIFFLGRRYVNIGTFIYILPYGTVVDFGGRLYHKLPFGQSLTGRVMGASIGCLLLYIGVAMFITADIGLDPFTGLVMVIRDRVGREYRIVKICFDVGCIVAGTLLGGKLGVITVLTALTAGPVIQLFAEKMQKAAAGRQHRT